MYWKAGRERIERTAIDGSEQEPTALSSSFFDAYDGYPYISRARLLGLVDGEPVVVTTIYEDHYNHPDCNDCPFGMTDGGIHTVAAAGDEARCHA